ncbi:hypothetical protein QC761_200885 [Podospora bellae-mahoneyi]|uniref:Uncharacterized protein n=1 Tax=Podospora bellae-mahoneyi TaxID=2093777 RepID=A0ABR0FN29_9PEZI|nr:hypothetical protein QC761_200885 [Podospora bellae-mahoneyi]
MIILHHSIVSTTQQVEALASDAGLLPNGKSGSAGLDRRVSSSKVVFSRLDTPLVTGPISDIPNLDHLAGPYTRLWICTKCSACPPGPHGVVANICTVRRAVVVVTCSGSTAQLPGEQEDILDVVALLSTGTSPDLLSHTVSLQPAHTATSPSLHQPLF